MTQSLSPNQPPLLIPEADRAHLSDTRSGLTTKNSVGGTEFYITVNFYAANPSRPGEVFITVAKEGSTLGGMCDALGVTISLALQYGVPWKALARKYYHSRFEPSGQSAQFPGQTYSSLIAAIAATIDHIIEVRRSRINDSPTPSAVSNDYSVPDEHSPSS